MTRRTALVRDRLGLVLALGAPVVPVAMYFSIPLGGFGPEHPVVSWISFGVALVLVAGLLLGAILGRLRRPGVVIVWLSCFSLVVFASAYLALARQPGQFSGLRTRIDALYFTVITMSTVGYGDISPAGQHARVVVMLQILYTLVFLVSAGSALRRLMQDRFKNSDRSVERGEH